MPYAYPFPFLLIDVADCLKVYFLCCFNKFNTESFVWYCFFKVVIQLHISLMDLPLKFTSFSYSGSQHSYPIVIRPSNVFSFVGHNKRDIRIGSPSFLNFDMITSENCSVLLQFKHKVFSTICFIFTSISSLYFIYGNYPIFAIRISV